MTQRHKHGSWCKAFSLLESPFHYGSSQSLFLWALKTPANMSIGKSFAQVANVHEHFSKPGDNLCYMIGIYLGWNRNNQIGHVRNQNITCEIVFVKPLENMQYAIGSISKISFESTYICMYLSVMKKFHCEIFIVTIQTYPIYRNHTNIPYKGQVRLIARGKSSPR
jgi:hypothetical protein